MFTRFLVMFSVLVLVPALCADTVQLVNGDTISGKVVSLDAKHLKLQSDVFGQMSIERGKIASIHLGDAPAPKAAKKTTTTPAPMDLLEQLKTQGIDPKTVADLRKAMPLLNTPEASKYFEDTLSGLMSGKLNLGDVRKDAQKALDEIKKLEKELGPDAAQALQGYRGILDGFLKSTPAPKQDPKNDPKNKKK